MNLTGITADDIDAYAAIIRTEMSEPGESRLNAVRAAERIISAALIPLQAAERERLTRLAVRRNAVYAAGPNRLRSFADAISEEGS